MTKPIATATALIISFFILTACNAASGEPTVKQAEVTAIELPQTPAPPNEPDEPDEPVEPDTPAEPDERAQFVETLLADMTTEQKIGQMLMLSVTNAEQAVSDIESLSIGGVIYFASNIDTEAQTKQLSDTLQSAAEIPLFIATDEEGGRVSRITKSGKIDTPPIPPARTLAKDGDSEKAYQAATAISQTLKRLGINVNLAPCADLSAEGSPANDVIGDRAFSHDPLITAAFVAKAIESYTENSILSAAKHFPGHGSAIGDTHLDKIISQKSLADLEQVDIIPFSAAIHANVPMLMLSHITVKDWEPAPASLSQDAVSFIRGMGFNGIIITDSFQMGAITKHYTAGEAAVLAVKAGVDIILMPQNAGEAFNALAQAVATGEISESQIDSSVRRILLAKYDYALFPQNF